MGGILAAMSEANIEAVRRATDALNRDDAARSTRSAG
jgi:hypothetical protein